MKLHANHRGELRRCVAEIRCEFGSAIARTLTRGGTAELHPSEAHLPIATSGETSRGGAAVNIDGIKEQRKDDPLFLQSLGMQARPFRASKRPTAPQAEEAFGITAQQWSTMTVSERGEAIREKIPEIRNLLSARNRGIQKDERLAINIEDKSLITTDVSSDGKGNDTLKIGRTFLKSAPLDVVWNAVAQSYGNLAFKDRQKYSAAWWQMMRRAGIPTDLDYKLTPQKGFAYIAACSTCKQGSYRPEQTNAVCKNCQQTTSQKNKLKFTKNPHYVGE